MAPPEIPEEIVILMADIVSLPPVMFIYFILILMETFIDQT